LLARTFFQARDQFSGLRMSSSCVPRELSGSACVPYPCLTSPVGFVVVDGCAGRLPDSVRPFPESRWRVPSFIRFLSTSRFSIQVLWPLLTSHRSHPPLLTGALPPEDDRLPVRFDSLRSPLAGPPSGCSMSAALPFRTVSPETSAAQTPHLPPGLNDGINGTAALLARSLPVPAHPIPSASSLRLPRSLLRACPVRRLATFP